MVARRPRSVAAGFAAVLLAAAVFATASAARPAPAAAASSAWVRSPSGNIGCYMATTWVRCDVIEHAYTPPPQPSACEFAWGPALEVGVSGRGHFGCVSDTVAGSARVLKYGKSIAIGPFRCTSRSSGMTCTNTKTRHGFTVSRVAYRLF